MGNFLESDREAAKLLLDSLSLVKVSEARPDLSRLISNRIKDLGTPVWLLPVMAKEDIEHHLRSRDMPIAPLVPFATFEIGDVGSVMPGSEGWIGNLIRTLVRESNGEMPFVGGPHATKKQLRDERVKTILLITDIVGSGKQVLDFIDILLANKTLKSWKSFQWVRFEVVSYVAAPQAELKLGPKQVDLHFVVREPTIETRPWTGAQKRSVIALCKKYVTEGVEPLGYGRNGGLFAFQESIPNTLPFILWRPETEGWHAFFDDRAMSMELETEVSSRRVAVRHQPAVAKAANQPRLGEALSRQMTRRGREVLLALAQLLTPGGSEATIEVALDLSSVEAKSLLNYMEKSGWIDGHLAVTSLGRRELDLGKRNTRSVLPRSPAKDHGVYYPWGHR